MPSDAEIAAEILTEENALRFAAFRADDAITLGMNLRKRYRTTAAKIHGARGPRGAVISVQTIQGTSLFSCAISPAQTASNPYGNLFPASLSNSSSLNGTSPESWSRLDAIMRVTARTGHSSFYIEKTRAVNASGSQAKSVTGGNDLSLPSPEFRMEGGAFPIWLVNCSTTPVAIIGLTSGSPLEDHAMIVSTLRHFASKGAVGGVNGIDLSVKEREREQREREGRDNGSGEGGD